MMTGVEASVEPKAAAAVTAAQFRRRALRQAMILMLVAALPAFGSWIIRQSKQTAALRLAAPSVAPSPHLPIAATTAPVAQSSAEQTVDLDQAAAWGNTVLWVDARQQADFERAHVPGALLLNEEEWDVLFPAVLERWSPERRVVVYCDGGACQASRQVAARLRDAGIPDAQSLRGGWPEWVKRFGKPK